MSPAADMPSASSVRTMGTGCCIACTPYHLQRAEHQTRVSVFTRSPYQHICRGGIHEASRKCRRMPRRKPHPNDNMSPASILYDIARGAPCNCHWLHDVRMLLRSLTPTVFEKSVQRSASSRVKTASKASSCRGRQSNYQKRETMARCSSTNYARQPRSRPLSCASVLHWHLASCFPGDAIQGQHNPLWARHQLATCASTQPARDL